MRPKKTEVYLSWASSDETRAFVQLLKREIGTDLFMALRRACRSSIDPNVREALAKWEYAQGIVDQLEAKNDDPS